jgi:hypothetical protein
MDQTANEIEAQIDRTRDRLGSNLRELEHRVDAATDWREHFRKRPQLFIGAAFIGGVMLANALRRTSPTRQSGNGAVRGVVGVSGSAQAQASELWNNLQGALIGVASAGIKEYIGSLVPGFDEHYRRVEQRAGAADSMTASLGRTGG